MEKAVTRIKKSQTSVPVSLFQADALLAKLGQTQDAINEVEKDLAKKIAEIKAKAAKKLRPLTVERSNQINALFTFANPRKAELTREVRSTVLGNGTFGWRWTTPRVELAKSDAETIDFLKYIKEVSFIRVVEEVDRQALLAERPVIAGISYVQDDEFFVVPKQKAKKAKTFTQAVDR
jgi:phage host-nuclease inhibitor protein Gam